MTDLFPDRAVGAASSTFATHDDVVFIEFGQTAMRDALSAALSVSPVIGLSEEEMEAVRLGSHREACVVGTTRSDESYCTCGLRSGRAKLAAALAAFREEGSVPGG